jgi:membrane-associated phospholipid phosphatase
MRTMWLFPSMHLAQASIAAWFLRKWRGVSSIVCAYFALLVVAIIILRWHYVVDILGGLVLAALGAWIVSRRQGPTTGDHDPTIQA